MDLVFLASLAMVFWWWWDNRRAGELAEALGVGTMHIKRDDLSGESYGGNKVRKLEFLLADAITRSTDTVVTFGCHGSNHALARP